MRKSAILFLLCLYTAASFGIGINAFYCCGKLSSVQVSLIGKQSSKDSDGCKSGCCQTRHQTIRLRGDQLGASHIVLSGPVSLEATASTHYFANLVVSCKHQPATPVHGPPILFNAPRYILHRDFRI